MLTVILQYYRFHFPHRETKTDGTGDLLTANAECQQQKWDQIRAHKLLISIFRFLHLYHGGPELSCSVLFPKMSYMNNFFQVLKEREE